MGFSFLKYLLLACYVVIVPLRAETQREWSSPQNISRSFPWGYLSDPEKPFTDVVVDSQGNATAVWTGAQRNWIGMLTGSYVIQASSRPFDGKWQSPITISPNDYEPSEPHIAVDPKGNVTVVWKSIEEGLHVIRACSKPFGKKWQTSLPVSPKDQQAFSPWIAVDPRGNALVIWKRCLHQSSGISVSYKPFGGTWGNPLLFEDIFPCSPRIAADSFGNATLVWRGSMRFAKQLVQTTSLLHGKRLKANPDVLSQIDFSKQTPDIAADPHGNMVAVWFATHKNERYIEAAFKPFGQEWEKVVSIFQMPRVSSPPQVVLDKNGNATALWNTLTGDGWLVHSSNKPFGKNWQPVETVFKAQKIVDITPLVVDARGNITTVWTSKKGSTYFVQSSYKPVGGNWQPALTIATSTNMLSSPRIASAPGGTIVAVWHMFDEKKFAVQVQAASSAR